MRLFLLCSTSFKDVQQAMTKLNETLDAAVTSFKQLGQQYNVIDTSKLHQRCGELESKWREVRTILPRRVEAVQEEITCWVEFETKLQGFQSWLEEVQDLREEWEAQESPAVQIESLEVSRIWCA